MGKTKNKLLIILMLVVLLATACGLLLSACVEDTFTVVLDANGGSFEGGGTTLVLSNLKVGDSIDLSLYAPTRDGYRLDNWTSADGQIFMTTVPYEITAISEPTTRLTAQWRGGSGDDETSAKEALEAILGAMTNGDNLHSEYSTTLSVPDGNGKTTKYSIEFASNVKRGIAGQGEYDYDIGFVVRDVTNNKGIVGLYVTDEYGVPGGLYVDTDPDDPKGSVFLLEDFNADYLLALVEKLPSVVPDALQDLISSLISGVNINVIDVLLDMALQATGNMTVDADGNEVYTLSFNPTALLELDALVTPLLGALLDSIDLAPLFS